MVVKIQRSPRAPALDLGDAIKKAQLMLKQQGCKQTVPSDVAAKHMGYSGINNGAAARAMGALKAFGLITANSKGDVAVAPEVEEYSYTPYPEKKNQLLDAWLKAPRVYADLIAASEEMLPSDEVLRYRLIQMGFTPTSAEECAKTFKASVEFARYYERKAETGSKQAFVEEPTATTTTPIAPSASAAPAQASAHATVNSPAVTQPQHHAHPQTPQQEGIDRIPVRLKNGRRAWIEVPTPFFEADKDLLKKHIDLILTDDAEDDG